MILVIFRFNVLQFLFDIEKISFMKILSQVESQNKHDGDSICGIISIFIYTVSLLYRLWHHVNVMTIVDEQ